MDRFRRVFQVGGRAWREWNAPIPEAKNTKISETFLLILFGLAKLLFVVILYLKTHSLRTVKEGYWGVSRSSR
jgi:hypothetical protein